MTKPEGVILTDNEDEEYEEGEDDDEEEEDDDDDDDDDDDIKMDENGDIVRVRKNKHIFHGVPLDVIDPDYNPEDELFSEEESNEKRIKRKKSESMREAMDICSFDQPGALGSGICDNLDSDLEDDSSSSDLVILNKKKRKLTIIDISDSSDDLISEEENLCNIGRVKTVREWERSSKIKKETVIDSSSEEDVPIMKENKKKLSKCLFFFSL